LVRWAVTHGDFDEDNDIDITDFNMLSANFAPGGYDGFANATPEPSAIVLLLLGGVVWICTKNISTRRYIGS